MNNAGLGGCLADHRGIRTAAVVLVALVLGVVCVMVWHYLIGNELAGLA